MSSTTLYVIIGVVALFFVYRMFLSPGAKVDPNEVQKAVEENNAKVIDVRTKGEYKAGHLAITNLNIDLASRDFDKRISKLDTSKTYYLYCRSGNRSGQAARIMKSKGFENVVNIGGYSALVRKGFKSAK